MYKCSSNSGWKKHLHRKWETKSITHIKFTIEIDLKSRSTFEISSYHINGLNCIFNTFYSHVPATKRHRTLIVTKLIQTCPKQIVKWNMIVRFFVFFYFFFFSYRLVTVWRVAKYRLEKLLTSLYTLWSPTAAGLRIGKRDNWIKIVFIFEWRSNVSVGFYHKLIHNSYTLRQMSHKLKTKDVDLVLASVRSSQASQWIGKRFPMHWVMNFSLFVGVFVSVKERNHWKGKPNWQVLKVVLI